jgi:hypothetical protein
MTQHQTNRDLVGNIVNVPKGVIMHQVNCQNAMGAGVARSLYEAYPQVKERYHMLTHDPRFNTPEKRFGLVQPVTISKDLIILNSFSQFDFGNSQYSGIVYTDENALMNNLLKLDQFAKERNLPAYVPGRIGCGLAGGDWNKIENFILNETDINIVTFEPNKQYGTAAPKPRYQPNMNQNQPNF